MSRTRDHADLTRVGPGTVMGEFMRQYWIPAALSSELAADGDPMRLLLLGEKLIAFRDSAGRVGVMDQRCPHRCASLFLGRNEEYGLRCVYHGWKFDVSGRCVDMPSVPAERDFKAKVKAKAYRTAERNGLVWVYMGARQEAPPLPAIEVALLPAEDMTQQFVQRRCNWLQALEGEIDTAHFGFLHMGCIGPDDLHPADKLRYTVTDRAPDYHVADAPWGTTYAAYRPADPGQLYWRVANFLFPFWTQTPAGSFPTHVGARAWVPMDDEHTMFLHLHWKRAAPSLPMVRQDGTVPLHLTRTLDYLPNDTGWHGRWRLRANEDNDWQIDRASQRDGRSFSGIGNIHLQDQAVTESMGPIVDHNLEHLGPSDRMITHTRRRLLKAARAWRDDGAAPPCVDDPTPYLKARSGYFLSEDGIDWRNAYARQVETAARPAPMPQAAE
ncbi:MAG TPA: Rieske 2Fe-2S domain-containing protein [Stellaceae bacterium]|nr:Rieske 2Fe-2S domain-containing protein [Stellaceae bacterium]